MQDRDEDASSKIPLLGDLPLLGHLFRTTSKTKMKTNLLLLLTPHIIRSPQDFEGISAAKTRERQQVLEEFWGDADTGEPPIDFQHKPGPLATFARAIQDEVRRTENGGPGNPGERVIRPSGP